MKKKSARAPKFCQRGHIQKDKQKVAPKANKAHKITFCRTKMSISKKYPSNKSMNPSESR